MLLRRSTVLPCAAAADHLYSYTETVNSGWKQTGSATFNAGNSSYAWLAKLTFSVPSGNAALLVVVDR